MANGTFALMLKIGIQITTALFGILENAGKQKTP